MVFFILDGCSFHYAQICSKLDILICFQHSASKESSNQRKKIGLDDSFDVTKCLQQIEIPDLLHVCE